MHIYIYIYVYVYIHTYIYDLCHEVAYSDATPLLRYGPGRNPVSGNPHLSRGSPWSPLSQTIHLYYTYIYIYMYIEREIERERDIHIHMYTYIYIYRERERHIYTRLVFTARLSNRGEFCANADVVVLSRGCQRITITCFRNIRLVEYDFATPNP